MAAGFPVWSCSVPRNRSKTSIRTIVPRTSVPESIASQMPIRWWRVNIGKILVTSSKTKCQDTSKVPSIRKNTKNVGFHHHQQQPKPNHPLLRIVTVRSLRRKRRRNWIYSMPKLRPIRCINRVVNYGTGILGSSAISRSI